MLTKLKRKNCLKYAIYFLTENLFKMLIFQYKKLLFKYILFKGSQKSESPIAFTHRKEVSRNSNFRLRLMKKKKNRDHIQQD